MTPPAINTAICETPLPNGEMCVIKASAVPLHGELLEPLKLGFPGTTGPLHADILSARFAEPRHDPRHRVTIAPLAGYSGDTPSLASFSAIVADRASRGIVPGLFPFAGVRLIALGASTDWITGALQPLPAPLHQHCLETLATATDLGTAVVLLPPPPTPACQNLHETIRTKHPQVTIHTVTELAELYGYPSRGADQHGRCRVWFPVLGGDTGQDRLVDLEVVVQPLATGEKESLRIIGLPENARPEREKIARLLRELREQDLHGTQEWNTLVRFPAQTQGDSYELALALADLIARGREFPGVGHLIATGSIFMDSAHNRSVRVGDVAGAARKCAAILRHLSTAGDRILLPEAWRAQVPEDFSGKVRERGASHVFIDRLF